MAKINTAFNLTPYKYLKFEMTSIGTYSIPVFLSVYLKTVIYREIIMQLNFPEQFPVEFIVLIFPD